MSAKIIELKQLKKVLDEPVYDNFYQKLYYECFKPGSFETQKESLDLLGKEFGKFSTLLTLPKSLLIETVGVSYLNRVCGTDLFTKYYYHKKISEAYNYIATAEREAARLIGSDINTKGGDLR